MINIIRIIPIFICSNLLGLFFASLMALFFGLAQVYSRQLKELPTSMINASTGIFGFVILLIISILIEGNIYNNFKNLTKVKNPLHS